MKIEFTSLVSRAKCDHEFILYEPGACTGCGKCSILCAAKLWSMAGGIAQFDKDYRNRCLECGACFHACPTSAIDFRYPDGGAGVAYQRG